MKKMIALLLALLLLGGLAACGGESGAATPAGPGTTEAEDTKEPAPENTESTSAAPDFEGCTVIDNESCLLTITGIDESSISGYTLKAHLENKTEDQTLCFTINSASVNGVSCEPFLFVTVPAGEKTEEDISFSGDKLMPLTEAYSDIEITFRVYDDDTWKDVAVETAHIYPLGENRASRFVREAQPTDVVLVDNDQYSVVVTGYDPESTWGYAVCLYLVNKSDITLTFSAEKVSVNGLACDPYWAEVVAPGKVAFSNMDWPASSFASKGITEVEEIEFVLGILDTEDIWKDALCMETVKLNP